MITEDLHQIFIDNIVKYRKKNKLSQSQLAEITGSSCSVISDHEAGRRSPTLRTLVRFSNAFGVSPDKLLKK